MKKILCAFFAFLIFVFNTNLVFAATGSNSPYATSYGDVIPVYFMSSVNSDSLSAGDLISFVVAEDVYQNGELLFRKNSNGYATLDKVVHSGGHGKAGVVQISTGRVKDIYDNQHMVKFNIDIKGESRKASAITLSVVGVLVILVPFGIWRKGDPATLCASKIINATLLN